MIVYGDKKEHLSDKIIMWFALDKKIKPPEERHFVDEEMMVRIKEHLEGCESCTEKLQKYCEETGQVVEEEE